jgi:energy-coupling factor transport system permease protein
VGEALRTRGLDTEGSVAARLRGVAPLGAAMVQGTLAEVEDRTLALEVRGFRSARRRTVLRPPPDSAAERALRAALLAVALAAIATRVWFR